MADRIAPVELIVKSKAKVLFAEADMRVGADAYSELGHQVTRAIKQAIRRAKANGRKTVKGSDF